MPGSVPHNNIPAHVLLVDDQPANLLALEASLAPLDVAFVRAETGRRAIELAGGGHAAMVLDDRLPDMRGEEVARQVIGALGDRCPPIVLYTAADFGRAERDAWRAAGIAEVLLKAGDPQVLRATLESFVRQARDLFTAPDGEC